MENNKYKGYRQLAIATAIPVLLVVTPLLGYYLGHWLDGKFGTGRLFTVIGLALGIAAAARETYEMIKKSSGNSK